jgi:hypothetical protein
VKNSLLKKGVGIAAALCTGVAVLAMAPAAHAVLPANTVAFAAGGSDTTENFMTQYLANFDGSTTLLPGKTVRTYNIPAFPTAGYVVDGDVTNCIQNVTWQQSGGTGVGTGVQNAPSGSGAGRSYLASQESPTAVGQRGCIDTARSSSFGKISSGDKATFEYYAYALDAVSWATPSLLAPSILTRQQVQDIYACVTTDWGTIGGTPGPIQRYLPQSASGTRSYFLGQYGITTAMLTTTNANCPAVKDNSVVDNNGGPNIKFEENQGKTIEAGDIAKAILPYSGGLWSYQSQNASNPDVDVRGGVRLGGVSAPGGALAAVKGNVVYWNTVDRAYNLNNQVGGTVLESNVTLANPLLTTNDYPGIRYVFNVLDNAGNLEGYQAGQTMVGFNNIGAGAKSPLCSNSPGGSADQQFAYFLISSVGFSPLGTVGGAAGSNNAAATCRRYIPT